MPLDNFVALEGAKNFRDAGGHATDDGASVRRGVLFRSGSMEALTDADHAMLAPLNVRLIFDLREDAERAAEPTRWPGPVIRSWADAPDAEGWESVMGRHPTTAAGVRAFYADYYRAIAMDFAPRIGEVVRAIAADEGPVVVHCAAGKDRTGISIAVLLALLGVPRAAIVADYMLSDQRYRPAPRATDDQWAGWPEDAVAAMFGTEEAHLDAAFAAIEAGYGSLAEYARRGMGIDDATLTRYRAAMLNPAS